MRKRTIALSPDGWSVEIIDQRHLPHRFVLERLETAAQMAHAIREMKVRGAPLIGVAAAYGVSLAMREDPSDEALSAACELLLATRPTAVNLGWALEDMRRILGPALPGQRMRLAYARASELGEADVAACRAIGEHGAELLGRLASRRGGPVRVLTHCNAGWLATVDWGTALAPVYVARERGVEVEVWVEETRPRNQGLLTAWELQQEGVPYCLIADNAGGHLMQRGDVDVCLVGTDRTTRSGDVANKIGTYLKALAARDTGVPFWVALPRSSYDEALEDGSEIAIEERDPREILEVTGMTERGEIERVSLAPAGTRARNPAFDVTPARLVTGFITEYGLCSASDLARVYAGGKS
ncbi:MAG TPA: S-methyl-5-thioribose-1-phosphate isomerase [Polyangiaceae bacterium]|nr:S-methyl-5-thioribose-1-phosphate isomerase [Polyangiaceae bacterium]